MKKIAYSLYYDENKNMYIYSDMKESTINEEEWMELLDIKNNVIKETTLSIIPSNFIDILLKAINPMCYVSINNHEIDVNYLNGIKYKIKLSDDCLVTNYNLQTEFGEKLNINISYDYVQDHFKEIDNPLEIYHTKILKDKE